MNGLQNPARTLETLNKEIVIDEQIRPRAMKPLTRMMAFGQPPGSQINTGTKTKVIRPSD